MDTAKRARDPRRARNGGAHQHWKDRWGRVVRNSMIVAAGAHLAAFAVWPTHEVGVPERGEPAGIIPLVRLAAHHSAAELPERSAAPRPEPRPVPVPPRDPGQAEETRSADLLESLLPPPPVLALPRDARTTLAGADEVLTRLAEAPPIAFRTDPHATLRAFTWPDIRNPGAMVRFFRARYNPIHTPPPTDRAVGVAVWLNERGVVEWSEVAESSGIAAVDEIALAAVSEVLEFTPARRNGIPIAIGVVLSIPFQIRW